MKRLFGKILTQRALLQLVATAIAMLFSISLAQAQSPAGTGIVNRDALLGSYKDKFWFKENIPFLEVPDQNIQEVYYYRWYSFYTNMKYVNDRVGYIETEFSKYVWWQSAYGAIPCSGSFHFYEGRWLKDQTFLNDLARYWTTGAGEPASRNYSFWKALSLYERYLVNGDADFLKKMYPSLIDNLNKWNGHFNAGIGLYRQQGVWDGMELSATSLQSDENTSGYRPTINAYMYGDMVALSKIARMLGNTADATAFETRANTLREKGNTLLWDESAGFFKHKWCEAVAGTAAYPRNKYYPKESFVDAREVYAYTMWYTNYAYDNTKYIDSWKYLFDAQSGFWAPYGPTTLERSHHLFRYQDGNCCHWNGMSWPFSTSETLVAIANVLNNYKNKGMLNKDRFVQLLQVYARTQYQNGKPYIAEAHDPDKDVWSYDLDRSKHYNHSTYNDIVISGLIGLRPRADDSLTVNPQVPDSWDYFLLEDVPYHGHLFTILFDKTGARYGRGAGFMVFEDGQRIFAQAGIGKITIPIKPADLSHNYGIASKINYAANVDTANNQYPRPSMSFCSRYDSPYEAIDGMIRFDEEPKSRCTTFGTPNTSDWFAIDYGQPRTINRVDLFFYQDARDIQVPASYTLEYWDGGSWVEIPNQNRLSATPINDRNVVRFPAITTNKIRTVMKNGAVRVGLTEFQTWNEILAGQYGNGTGLSATYFTGKNFETPILSRIDNTVNFDWGMASPDAQLPSDGFSVRWEGLIQPLFTETYTFYLNSDNGRRLWIDGKLIIDKWLDDWNIDYSAQVALEAGQKHSIRIDYFENNGGANISLQWESKSQFRQVVPRSQLYPTQVINLPGKVEAENFSLRQGVITKGSPDIGGGLILANIDNGDFTTYEVNAKTAGRYRFIVRYTSATQGGTLAILSNETSLASLALKTTGSWNSWRTDSIDVTLTEGRQTLKLAFTGGNSLFDLNWIDVQYPRDCKGVINGTAKIDACGICSGGTTGITPCVLQTIGLQKGWNLISTNLSPTDSSIATLFKGLDIQEIKNMNSFWRKGQIDAFNSLTKITSGEGYLVNMNTAGTLTVTGTPVSFSNFQINQFSNWHLIGCPYQTATPLSTNFNTTNCSIIKNFEGFWMPNGSSNSIQNLEPGKGYFIRK